MEQYPIGDHPQQLFLKTIGYLSDDEYQASQQREQIRNTVKMTRELRNSMAKTPNIFYIYPTEEYIDLGVKIIEDAIGQYLYSSSKDFSEFKPKEVLESNWPDKDKMEVNGRKIPVADFHFFFAGAEDALNEAMGYVINDWQDDEDAPCIILNRVEGDGRVRRVVYKAEDFGKEGAHPISFVEITTESPEEKHYSKQAHKRRLCLDLIVTILMVQCRLRRRHQRNAHSEGVLGFQDEYWKRIMKKGYYFLVLLTLDSPGQIQQYAELREESGFNFSAPEGNLNHESVNHTTRWTSIDQKYSERFDSYLESLATGSKSKKRPAEDDTSAVEDLDAADGGDDETPKRIGGTYDLLAAPKEYLAKIKDLDIRAQHIWDDIELTLYLQTKGDGYRANLMKILDWNMESEHVDKFTKEFDQLQEDRENLKEEIELVQDMLLPWGAYNTDYDTEQSSEED